MNRPTAGPRRAAAGAMSAAERDEARGRGSLVVADKVFEKIAGQAASEVSTSRGRTGGLFGIGAESDAGARPKVDVELAQDSLDLDLALGIAYPGSIRAATQQIRDHVTRTVQDLTGVTVHRIDIDVTFLTVSGQPERKKEALR